VTLLSFDRYCAEILAQTDALRSCIEGADPNTPVPSCPDWSLAELLRHLGRAQIRAEATVRTRATRPLAADGLPDAPDDDAALGAWLAESAERLAATLRSAGPDAQVWTFMPDAPNTFFWARRMTHETVVHRDDAALAVGAEFTVEPDVALDALDEWMEFGTLPMMLERHPERRDLLGPGRTIHLHATDTAPETAAEWLIDLSGDAVTWRRAHEKAAVAVRGPLTDLLRLVYRRRPTGAEGLEVLGDAKLLDFWLERIAFG
jgi:uncharacterized protein (TIGR03083 family)